VLNELIPLQTVV